MCRFVLALLLSAALLPHPADAGAWLREKGSVFLSFGATLKENSAEPEQNYYGEYGIGAKLTLGATVTVSQSSRGEGNIFLRFPIRNRDRKAKIAAEIGLGAIIDETGESPFLRTGLSWGKGLTLRGKGGWINLDGNVLWSMGDKDHQLKIDATIGIKLNDRFKLMGQTFLFSDTSETSVTVSPGIVMKVGKKKNHLQVAIDQKFGGDDKAALRIGLWQEF